MKRRFDLPMLLLTLALSALGMFICLPLRDALSGSVPGRAVWCALWFALPLTLGLLGVEAGLALHHKRFRPARKRSFLAGLLAALLLGAAIGGGGGMLCMMEFRSAEKIPISDDNSPPVTDPPEYETPEVDPPESQSVPPEDEEPPENVPAIKHAVLLIDASDSARLNDKEARLAPCRVIDALSEDAFMQAAVFAYAPTAEDVRYKTDYLQLEDGVKEELKEFIQNTDIVGGTSFEGPIQLALETLEGRSSGEEPAAIIMFTDGDSPLSPETCDAVMESGVRLCLIRANPAQTPDAQQLVQLAEATGGGDLSISDLVGSGNSVTESYVGGEQTKAQPDAAQGETRLELTFGASLPSDGFGESFNVWRIAACIITYVLYAVLATVVYYRRITLVGLAGSLCAGCLTVCAATIDPRLCIPATAVLLLGAYTIYQVKEETAHV